MYNGYLYPGDAIKPLEEGRGYRDYLLSGLLDYFNLKMDYGEMRYASEPVVVVNGFPRQASCCLAVVFLEPKDDGLIHYLVFAPKNYYRNDHELAENVGLYSNMENSVYPVRFFRDLRIRFYLYPGGVRRPVWISASFGDKEYKPLFSEIPYCTELIEGPVEKVARNYAELGLASKFLDKIE